MTNTNVLDCALRSLRASEYRLTKLDNEGGWGELSGNYLDRADLIYAAQVGADTVANLIEKRSNYKVAAEDLTDWDGAYDVYFDDREELTVYGFEQAIMFVRGEVPSDSSLVGTDFDQFVFDLERLGDASVDVSAADWSFETIRLVRAY